MAELDQTPVAGNGLLDRRIFLKAGVAGGAALLTAQAGGVEREAWMKMPGAPMSDNGEPSAHESHVKRLAISSQPGTTGTGVSRTPLEFLDGLITPSRLHFERHHSGIPDINPDDHRLVIHGMVDRPLSFSLEVLARYPMMSRIQFLECSGNSGGLIAPEPIQQSCGVLHGLVAASEWGGVPLSVLLDEAGVVYNPFADRWSLSSDMDVNYMVLAEKTKERPKA